MLAERESHDGDASKEASALRERLTLNNQKPQPVTISSACLYISMHTVIVSATSAS